MTMPAVEERVDRLEESIDRFIASVGVEFNKLYNSQMRTEAELQAFKEEMRLYREDTQVFKEDTQAFKDEMRLYREDTQAFKDEMRLYREDTQAFKDEMRLYREDTQAFKDEMRLYREDTQAFKDEMRVFKDEMRVFKDRMDTFRENSEQDRREMNRKWGDLANKLGTMVEDLVYPSLPRVIQQTVGQEPDRVAIRVKQRGPDGRRKEFDAYAVTADLVFLNSTKATLRSADVDAFISEIATFRDYFPEYRDLPLIGILATLAVEESVLTYAEKHGFLVLAVGDEVMEVKNHPGFEPKRW